jgi:hypothetical protein
MNNCECRKGILSDSPTISKMDEISHDCFLVHPFHFEATIYRYDTLNSMKVTMCRYIPPESYILPFLPIRFLDFAHASFFNPAL